MEFTGIKEWNLYGVCVEIQAIVRLPKRINSN
jgi:hypothetical protein